MTKFLNVLMEERNEKEAVGFFGNWAKHTIENKKKEAYDWRYENSITNGKKIQIDGDYSQWRINSILSNFKDTILYANEMNVNHIITNQMHYDYLHGSIRKQNRWSKSESKQEKKVREHQESIISLISDYYKYNIVRAKEVLKILTPEQIEIIRKKKEKGGVK